MNKQSLSSLTLQQLYQHREILVKRIDDLKFFNLDLGRENIRLAEQYRVARDHAEKVKQGKAHKLRKAKNFTKNVYIHQQPRYSHIQHVQKAKNDSKSGFNFNDIYKVGKSKLVGWWGGNGSEKKSYIENVNQPMQNYYPHINNNYGREEQLPPVNHVVIVADCPPAQVMRQSEGDDKDPLQQPITQIIRQSSTSITHQSPAQQKYERLYHQNDHQRYIREQQQQLIMLNQMHGKMQQDPVNVKSNQTEKAYHYDANKLYHYDQKNISTTKSQNKKQTNLKNFQFDDLPGLGWKKLKGFIGFGSKTKNHNKYTPQQPLNNIQPPYQQQNSNYIPKTYPDQKNQQEQKTLPKKRTPIFGNYYLSPKEEQVQKQQQHKQDTKAQENQGL